MTPHRKSLKIDTKNPRFRRLAKEGSWVVLGQIAVVLGSIASIRILTEFLTPDEFGHLALSLTLVGLYSQVVFGGVSQGIGRYYAIASEQSELRSYLAAARQLLIYATAASLALGLVTVMGLGFTGNTQWLGIALSATALAVLQGYNTTLNSIQNAARQRAIVALHGALDAWLKIVLAVAIVFWLGSSSLAVVFGFAISTALVIFSQLFFLRKAIPPQLHRYSTEIGTRWTSTMWAYSWPFSTWGVFTWMQQVSDRWALGLYATVQDVGLYAVVFQLGYTPIALFLNLAVAFISPILYARAGDARSANRNQDVHRIIWRIAFVALGLTAVAVGFAAMLHRPILLLLVAEEYRELSYLLPWVILAGGVFASGQMVALKLMSDLKSRELLVPKIATALIGLALNLVGAVVAGTYGVVAAMVAFSTIYLTWIILLARGAGLGLRETECMGS